MRQHLVRFAAQDKSRHASPPMRGHYNQVALLFLGRVDNGFPGVVVALSDSFDLQACFAGKPFDDGEFFVGKFHRFAVNDAGEVLRNQAARHCAVQRQGHRHANDLGLREFGKPYAMPNSSFAELGSISRKENGLASFRVQQIVRTVAAVVTRLYVRIALK